MPKKKSARVREVLEKTVKIESFFSKINTGNENIPETSKESNKAMNSDNSEDKDPAKWIVDDSYRDYFVLHGFEQKENADFSMSKREYSDQVRYFSPRIFQRELLNGEKTMRAWSSIKGKLALKRLSRTRWSARDDACRSLNESWSEIIESLSLIEDDSTEKAITRSEAKGLRTRLERLETAFMSVF
ncbi:hypothetical protein CBL_20465 [Carabus blaptoides fortunei]